MYITLADKKEIESQIEKTKKEVNKLKETKISYERKLENYKAVMEDEDKSIPDLMEEELKSLKEVSGMSKISGEGVIITIKDSDKELASGQNPNDLIVHDIDIIRVINDLKKSGAKAISINGERLLPLSKIKCSGATITVNDKTYGQPFIISAIGDKDILMASMISPQSYANLLKDGYGIYIKVKQKDGITINSYKKSI
jgi:uncharacterized protein YlxW (UPF0749 family)